MAARAPHRGDAHLPVLGHRGLDPAARRRSGAWRTRRSSSARRRCSARRSCAHGGREEGTEGDSFFVVFDSAVEAVLRGRRGAAGARDGAVAGRASRSTCGWACMPARRPNRRQASWARHQPRGADRGGGPRRPGRGLGRGPDARHAGARHRDLAARPREPPAQGPARAAAAVPGRRRRAADGVPAAALARCPPEQPADPADVVRRAGARARRGRASCWRPTASSR